MKIVVTGAGGQLGGALRRRTASDAGVIWRFIPRQAWDISSREQGERWMRQERPDWVINAAAFTAVDQAENHRSEAWRINAEAPGLLAALCERFESRLLHVSTDYVFGEAPRPLRPWTENDRPQPINVYGWSKWQGEMALRDYPDVAWVVRAGWLFSSNANSFLVKLINRAKNGGRVRVVDDQKGTPTNVDQLAETLMALIKAISNDTRVPNLLHVAGGVPASWFEFACFALNALPEEVRQQLPTVEPMATTELGLPARRPSWSVLDDTLLQSLPLDLPRMDWRQGLAGVVLAAWQSSW